MHTGTGFANGQMHTGTGSALVYQMVSPIIKITEVQLTCMAAKSFNPFSNVAIVS